jgi:hypothetical protein
MKRSRNSALAVRTSTDIDHCCRQVLRSLNGTLSSGVSLKKKPLLAHSRSKRPSRYPTKGLRMTEQRRHFKQALNLKQRLLDRVRSLRDEANSMNPGLERDTEAGQMDKILKAIRDRHDICRHDGASYGGPLCP